MVEKLFINYSNKKWQVIRIIDPVKKIYNLAVSFRKQGSLMNTCSYRWLSPGLPVQLFAVTIRPQQPQICIKFCRVWYPGSVMLEPTYPSILFHTDTVRLAWKIGKDEKFWKSQNILSLNYSMKPSKQVWFLLKISTVCLLKWLIDF